MSRISRMSIGIGGLVVASLTQLGCLAGEGVITPGGVWRDDRGRVINAHGGGILAHGGRFYWFGEHKLDGEIGNTAQVGVHVYDSRDLLNWHDGGIALAVSSDPSSDIARGAIIERPKVLYNPRTHRFVMWFHLELKGQGYRAARAGVAVSETVRGPYRYLGSFRPDAGRWPLDGTDQDRVPGPTNDLARDFSGGQMCRDLTLFVDDDGTAYLIYVSEENRTIHISRLTRDWLRTEGPYRRILVGGNNEAPTILKRNGRFFIITSATTGWVPNAARLASASSMLGEWTPRPNPVDGTQEEMATTFNAQGAAILRLGGRTERFIFMADRWNEHHPSDSRYVWLPIAWHNDLPVLRWRSGWRPGPVRPPP